MNTILKSIGKVLMLPVNLVRWLLRALLWLIAMPFRIINAIFLFPFWFLRWLFSFLHHKRIIPATIVRMQQVQNFADQEGHVVFNSRGETIPIRLTMYGRKKFFRRNSEGDVGRLAHRGNWLVKWKLATVDNPVVSGEKTPLVFLSYAHKWKDDAKYVATYIGARGVKVWFDDERLMVGDALNKKVIQAVQNADYFIPLLCRDYNLSKWCIQELETAVEADCKILPVKVESGELVMPPYINRLFKANLGDPLFIDLRKRNPIDQLKELITTMTG